MIKVRDWVNVIINVEDGKVVHNRIAKCHNHRNGLVHYFNGDRIIYAIEENIEKLPIKFKPFDIVLQPAGDQLRWDCARAPRGGHIHFACVVVDGKFHVGINPSKGKYICADFQTITKAKDWLELQYATLLAKARGLL